MVFDQNNNQNAEPRAYRVEDDDNLEENDLRRSYLFGKGDEEKAGNEPNMEAEGNGGERFGQNSNTPAGDDRNNPSQNAGYSNEYFRRTEPLEEHPEHNNFKDGNQLGQSNYTEATGQAPTGQSDEENTAPGEEVSSEETVNNDENREESFQDYQEGTADDDGNIPGPNELPDQQKVAE
jgi:hypothetical protein